MLRHLGPLGKGMLWQLCTVVIMDSRVPKEWHRSILYPILKTATWSGDLDAVRYIVLLEHAWKLCSKIMIKRICQILADKQILQANNNSVLKETSVAGPLHIVNAVMEDAQEKKRPLWIVFQDI